MTVLVSGESPAGPFLIWSGAQGVLPATPTDPLVTQNGNTLDDGSGNMDITGTLTLDGVVVGGSVYIPSGQVYSYAPPIPSAWTTTLASAITSTIATSISLTAAIGPSSGDWMLQIDSEQMLVTAGDSTSTLTVQRGYNGTTAATHLIGDTVTAQAGVLVWTCPVSGTYAFFCVADGPSGPGGSTALTIGGVATQVGSSGGGGGLWTSQDAYCTLNSVYTIMVGLGAAGGTGASINANVGGSGTAGWGTQITGPGISTIRVDSGSPGRAAAANSTTTVNAGIMGAAATLGSVSSLQPGGGGPATSTGANGAVPSPYAVGSTSATPASATLGGLGGLVASRWGTGVVQPSGNSGSANGTNGADATAYGCAGAPGGPGAPGGTGGNGGHGMTGYAEWKLAG
jgi:hypothetical protein